MLRVGDKVTRPVVFTGLDAMTLMLRGVVVYVHSKGRFHVVEFRDGARPFRESYFGVEK